MKAVIVTFIMTAAIFSIGSALSRATQQAPAQTPDADGIYAAVLPTVSNLPRNEFLILRNTVAYANTEKAFPVDPNNIASKEQFEAQLRNATREEQDAVAEAEHCLHPRS